MNNIIDEIKVSNNIVLLCHINPDGDAIGSTLAMYESLKKLGKDVDVLIEDPPEVFNYIKNFTSIKKSSTKKYEVAIILDTASRERVSDPSNILDSVSKIIVIDHHISNTNYGNYNLVEKYPACCELVYNLIKEMDITIDKDIAVPIATGLLTDTGGFSHNDVLPSTFFLAGELSKIIDMSKIYKKVLKSISINQFNIKKIAMDNLKITSSGIAYSYITEEDILNTNVTQNDCGILVNIPMEIDTVEVSILARIFKDKVRISLRSNNIDVNEVASIFGGAGHKNAAGITTNMPYEELIKKLLEVLEGKIYEWNINSKQAQKLYK